MRAEVDQYLRQNQTAFVEDLLQLLRIPSVSADPAYKSAVVDAARFVQKQFLDCGIKAEIVPTAGHPIVYAEWCNAPGKPTVLVYGHYDVQPADPLNLWTTPPFEPAIREGQIFARGATDDKGQMLTHVKSAQAWMKSVGSLPINLKFVIEGEEEVGSNNLELFLEERKSALACDVAVISDTSQFRADLPAITYGLRGILACEVTVTGPAKDLHSGIFGGAVANPVNGAARLIASLHDEHGRIRIPGFYDGVLPLSEKERQDFAALPFDEKTFCQDIGISATAGEAGFTTLERRWARPTCDVNGMLGGYTGEGPKTIIPSKAMFKITCRLVPDQDPDKLVASLEKYLKSQCPAGLTLSFKNEHGCPAFVFDPNSPYLAAARSAIEHAFGKPPVLIREGGSIPVVGTLKDVLGVNTLLLGWGLNTDNLHSPDEHFALVNFERGTRASAELWERLADCC